MIGILNYGVGNVEAFLNSFRRLDIEAVSVTSGSLIGRCSHLILPGVGSFDAAMQAFNSSGLRKETEVHAIKEKKPLLGICVGMQMLAYASEEGQEKGLNLIEGYVRKFDDKTLLCPHMGWNLVVPCSDNLILKDFDKYREFYFLHSYYFDAYQKDTVIAQTKYNNPYPSIICHGNIYGMQCHPEKSHLAGLNFLKNFTRLI